MTFEYPPEKKEDSVLTIARKIEELENPEDIKVAVRELMEHLDADLHLELTSNVDELYREMQSEHLLARLESIRKVIECLEEHSAIEVGKGGTNYANSVVPETEGLRIAYAEGEAPGPIRLMVGLDVKALIGFKHDHLSVSEIDDTVDDLRDIALRKAYCRHIEGEILSDDIRYLILRVPRKLFPADYLTSEENGVESQFIFRGSRVGARVATSGEQLAA